MAVPPVKVLLNVDVPAFNVKFGFAPFIVKPSVFSVIVEDPKVNAETLGAAATKNLANEQL